MITFYPADFDAKEEVVRLLEAYNDVMEQEGYPDVDLRRADDRAAGGAEVREDSRRAESGYQRPRVGELKMGKKNILILAGLTVVSAVATGLYLKWK